MKYFKFLKLIVFLVLSLFTNSAAKAQSLTFTSYQIVLNEADTFWMGDINLENCSYSTLYQGFSDNIFITSDISFDSDSIFYAFTPINAAGENEFDLWSMEFDPFFIASGEEQYDEIKEGITCDKQGNLYLAGEQLSRWNSATGQNTELGDLPSSMYCQGDLTFRQGKLYLSSVNHTLVEVDLNNPMNSSVVMTFPSGIGDIHGLATVNLECDSVETYAAASNLFGGSTIYRIDFDTWTLEEMCHFDFFIAGLASYDECIFPDCLINVDLDIDNSSGTVGSNDFRYEPEETCVLPLAISDTDVEIHSDLEMLDSIEISLTNTFNTDEYLSLVAGFNVLVSGNETEVLTLKNNGTSEVSDFRNALTSVLYNNDVSTPIYGERIIEIRAHFGFYQSTFARTYIPINEIIFDPVFTIDPISCFENSDASVTSNPQGGASPYSFSWSSNQSENQINNLDTGQYFLTITDALGCTDVESINIDQPELLEVFISNPGFDTICNQSGVLFADPIGGTSPYTYTWSDGFDSALNEQLNPGNYTITIEDINGCQTENAYTLEEGVDVVINIEETPCYEETLLIEGQAYSSDTSFCLSYILPNGCDSIRCYELDFYEENTTNFYDEICNGDSLLIFGDYYSNDTLVTLVMTDINGCDSSLLFELNVLDPLDIEFESNGSLCNDGVVALSVNGFEQFEWSTGESGSTITIDESGDYGITVTDSNGCTNTSSTIIEESELIVFWTATNPSCFGISDGMIQIDSIIGGGESNLTSLNGGPLLTLLSYDNLPPGDHTIKVVSSNSCEYLIEVTLGEPAEILIQQSETSIFLAAGASIDVSIATNYSNAEILWSPIDYLDCTTCFENTISATSSIEYELLVTTMSGCTATSSINVVVEDAKIFVPNVFSPNGDFINDQLKVYGSSLVEQVVDLTIISRNGHVVFNNKNFQADESQQGWDGTFRNEKAQQGVYVLYLEYKDIQGNIRKEIYSVTLLD